MCVCVSVLEQRTNERTDMIRTKCKKIPPTTLTTGKRTRVGVNCKQLAIINQILTNDTINNNAITLNGALIKRRRNKIISLLSSDVPKRVKQRKGGSNYIIIIIIIDRSEID